MSISGIGGGFGSASQMLSILLSRLDQTPAATNESDAGTQAVSSSNTGGQPAIHGNAKPNLSSMVIGALIAEQMQSSDASTSSTENPVQSLFSTMDSDGDGTVSQAEMESFIQSKGGTQGEADTLYGMLTEGGSRELTETQLASQAPPPPPDGPEGAAGRHRRHHPGVSASDGANALVQALDTDGNGSVDQSELTTFVNANGGGDDQAASLFASLDASNTGALSSADFAAAIEKLQDDDYSTSNALVMTMLNAFDRATTKTQITSVSA